jgi:hypothetical protein
MLTSRLILVTSLFLTTGACDRLRTPTIEAQPKVAEADLRAFFCDHTEDSRFTQEEIETRTAFGWTRNLAISYRVNERRDRWNCNG